MKNRYFYINMSSSFKQLFFGLSVLCFLFAITIYFVDPNDPGVTLNLGGYSQLPALFLACLGSLLIPLYYLLARVFKSDYVAKPSNKNEHENWYK